MLSDPGRVQFANFPRAIAGLREELDSAIADVLERGWLILGPEVEGFESSLAELIGAPRAVGCASGTDAIELALRGLGIGPGDEVVTQANTCVPTVAAIARAGATPVLCDVEASAATIDPESMRRALGPRTKAVIPVHLYGQCGDIDAVVQIAGARGISVVEDCAQAIGATHSDRGLGSIGVAGCFSFYPTKNLGALGDGGAVVCSDEELADRLRSLRVYGQEDRYLHTAQGINSRLDELQAAILRVKLPHLAGWNERRRSIAAAYAEALSDGPVRALPALAGRSHVHHLFVVEAPDRERFREELEALGVQTLVHYPHPIHQQPAYRELANGPTSLSTSERLAARIVSLPIYPELSDAEVEHVANSARAAASRLG